MRIAAMRRKMPENLVRRTMAAASRGPLNESGETAAPLSRWGDDGISTYVLEGGREMFGPRRRPTRTQPEQY